VTAARDDGQGGGDPSSRAGGSTERSLYTPIGTDIPEGERFSHHPHDTSMPPDVMRPDVSPGRTIALMQAPS